MIIKIDNIKCQAIIGGTDNLLDFDIKAALKEYLKARVKGYQYTPAYKRRGWDGYKHFISSSGMFATGFLPLVLKELDRLNVPEVIIQDERVNQPRFKEEFVTDINVWSLRDYQEGPVKKAKSHIMFRGQTIPFYRGIYDCATNSGKNSIMAGITMNVENPKAIMLIHSVDIFTQAVAFFSNVFGHKNVGIIDSKNYRIGNVFTIAMYKSLLNKMKASINVRQDMGVYNLFFVDESHKVGDGDYGEVIVNISNACARYFVSGTPLDSEDMVKRLVIVGLSGPVLSKITNQEMIDKKVSLKPTVHMLLNKRVISEVFFDYKSEYDGRVMLSRERMRAVMDFLYERKGKYVMIAFNETKHGEYVYETLINDPRFRSVNIELTHGKDLKDRANKLERFRTGSTQILVCSKIAEAGLNLPLMNILVYMIGGKDKTAMKQFMGRLIRDDQINTTVEYVDFYDTGNWVEKHSRKRIRIYKDEGFELEYHYQNKRGYYYAPGQQS